MKGILFLLVLICTGQALSAQYVYTINTSNKGVAIVSDAYKVWAIK